MGTAAFLRMLPALAILAGAASAEPSAPGGAPSRDAATPRCASGPSPSPFTTRLPILLLENAGQVRGAADFHAPLADGGLYLHTGGMTRTLRRPDRAGPAHAVRMEVPGAPRDGRWRPEGPESTVFRWFRGSGAAPARMARSWTAAVLEEVRPGIDLLLESRPGGVEYSFVLAPGAAASSVRVRWSGVDAVEPDPSGALRVRTPAGAWDDAPPRAWQEREGRRVPVAAAWTAPAHLGGGVHEAGFSLGPVDPAFPLVIDPGFAAYAGYVGGSAADAATCVAPASGGRVVMGGSTASAETTFPVEAGPFLEHGGHDDGFLAVVAADGVALEWCGYLGGSGFEVIEALAVDGADESVVAVGRTTTDDGTFPVLGGPSTEYGGGSQDGFVVRVAADGASLVHGGFLGGTGPDMARGLALDADGTLVVAGESWSSDGSFPVSVGPATVHGGGSDAFVARLTADGASILSAGFIGGTGNEGAFGAAVDSDGRMILAGRIVTGADAFPDTGRRHGASPGGAEAFVALVSADGADLDVAAVLGGSADDGAASVSVFPDGSVAVGGWTRSSDLPVTGGPGLSHGGNLDGFVAVLDAAGGLRTMGYMGGALDDEVTAVVASADGSVLAAGYARSVAGDFPVRGGPSTVMAGGRDAFVARIKPGGRGFAFSGFLGGADAENARAVAEGDDGALLLAGDARSLPAVTGPGLVYGGVVDAFVARLDPAPWTFVRTAALGEGPKGSITDSSKPSRDKFALRGVLTLDPGAGPDPFDPLTEDLGVWAGDVLAPVGFTIAGGDAGWTIRGRKYLWKSPKGVLPKRKLLLDFDRAKFTLSVTKAEFPVAPSGRTGVFLQGGRLDLEYESEWTPKKPGAFRTP